jgi:2,4-didehydro-3-deoxy-L-rhamnonate hydrolase
MKLVRFGEAGKERPGLIDPDGWIRDLSAIIPDIDAAALAAANLARLRDLDPSRLPLVREGVRLGPPVAGSGKIICIGLNYVDHAREAGLQAPAEPVVFLKATSALTGPDDPIILPPDSVKTDWELELAVVIGATARHVSLDEAPACVAGWCVALDMSERHWQLERGGQWDKGKSFDSFAPLGPWLVTSDELPVPRDLAMQLAVNRTTFQQGSSANMIFNVWTLVSYVSGVMTLQPGDLIFTGTPAGVGMGQQPPRYLQPGDSIHATITGLGAQQHAVAGGDPGVGRRPDAKIIQGW